MNTKTLVVGQRVVMRSGCYGYEGAVIRVGPLGVDVQTDEGELFQFDQKGLERDGKSTYECGLWEIDDETPAQDLKRAGCKP